MLVFLTVLIAVDCVLLMGIVLIQNPKGGGLDSTFGGTGAANQMLGAAKSTDFIEKLTWGLATALFVLCLITSVFVGTGGSNSGPGTRTNPESMILPSDDVIPVQGTETFLYQG